MFSIEDLSWNVAIQDEKYSIISALWTPNCKYLVTSSECNLQTCVWSLSSKIVYFIGSVLSQNRKELPGVYNLKRCCTFSRDGEWMALLHTQTLSTSSRQDQISIFNTSTWECAITFALSTQRARQVVFFVITETLIL